MITKPAVTKSADSSKASALPTVTTTSPVSPGVKTNRATKDNTLTLQFSAPAGCYRFTAIADASDFDWESLYFPLTLFKNTGQRSGPWDFDTRNNNKPLVPAYWVTCDGVKLGLWYFQRVSLQDMERRVFRGNVAFKLKNDGEHTLKLTPYHDNPLPWFSATLGLRSDEQPANDWLEKITSQKLARKTSRPKNSEKNRRAVSPTASSSASPAADSASLPIDAWNDPAFWQRIHNNLANTDKLQGQSWTQPFLDETLTWAMKNENPLKAALLPLVFKARLHHDAAALAKAIAMVMDIVKLPHFGNPNPEGYGHNGDMAAADQLLNLALATHLLQNELTTAQQKAIEKKFVLQATKFVDAALLNDDYWGGSLLQDHGWRSYMLFSTALLHMPVVLNKHPDLLAFALGRVRQSIKVMPRDGVIPWSSYGYPHLYLDAAAQLRKTLLAVSDIDLYEQGPWLEIIHYLHSVTDASGKFMILRAANQDEPPLIGGLAFCLQMAVKHNDGRALQLARLIAQRPAPQKFYCSTQAISYLHQPIIALCETWAAVKPKEVRDITEKKARLDYFADSGLIRHHNPRTGLTFTLRCAPFAGWHAYQNTHGPCDRIHIIPDDGHFALLHQNDSLLASTEHGYRLRSATRSCLLIDDQGQYGDVDYPMSLPSYNYPGQHISHVSDDRVELDLTAAYPKDKQVLAYKRRFLFLPGNIIHCVDSITLAKPAKLDWLFHSREAHGLSLRGQRGLRFQIGSPARLTIEPRQTSLSHNAKLSAAISPTEILWSYDSCTSWAPVSAVRYTTGVKVTAASVAFVIKYTPGR